MSGTPPPPPSREVQVDFFYVSVSVTRTVGPSLLAPAFVLGVLLSEHSKRSH